MRKLTMSKKLKAIRKLRYLTVLLILVAMLCLVVGVSSYVYSARNPAPAPVEGTATIPVPQQGDGTGPAEGIATSPAPSLGEGTNGEPALGSQPSPAGGVIAAQGPSLGAAASFGVLAGTMVQNTGATTIVGDVGVSPGSTTPGLTADMVTGAIYLNDAVAAQAHADVIAARSALAGETCTTNYTDVPQQLGGLTLAPGVYCFGSTAELSGTLTLDSQGDLNPLWVFKIPSTLTTTTGSSVVLSGTTGCGVFWNVDNAIIGPSSAFAGNILAATNISLGAGASIAPGRALAVDGAVTLSANNITITPCGDPTPGTLSLVLTCDGASFSGEAVISTSVDYSLSDGVAGSQAVGPGPFAFDVPWNPPIQGLVGPFVMTATGTLDLGQLEEPDVTVNGTETLTCSGNG